jgi:hypothetical protein
MLLVNIHNRITTPILLHEHEYNLIHRPLTIISHKHRSIEIEFIDRRLDIERTGREELERD